MHFRKSPCSFAMSSLTHSQRGVSLLVGGVNTARPPAGRRWGSSLHAGSVQLPRSQVSPSLTQTQQAPKTDCGARAGNTGRGSLLQSKTPTSPGGRARGSWGPRLASPALALHVWLSVMTTLLTPLPCKGLRPPSRVPHRGDPMEASPSTVPCPGIPGPCTICLPGADLPRSSWSPLTEPPQGPEKGLQCP